MQLLFVNACMRGPVLSRTHALCRAFMTAAREEDPGLTILEHDLTRMNLRPIDADTLPFKEALADERDWEAPLLRPALEFAQSDAVVIGAPYWDLSFPSALKIWVEHMYVRNLTFRYEDGKPIGLAQGKKAYYLSTAGSPIGENDWGAGYMKAVLNLLGVPEFTSIRAEGVDIDGWDKEKILREAEQKAVAAGRDLGRWTKSADE